MGYELRRMIDVGATPEWTGAMRFLAGLVADNARDPSGSDLKPGELPWSRIPIKGHVIEKGPKRGQWQPGLVELTGFDEAYISKILRQLAKVGYEMRAPIRGKDGEPMVGKDGRVIFALPGKSLTFIVPPLMPYAGTVAGTPQQDGSAEADEAPKGHPEVALGPPRGCPSGGKGHPEVAPSPHPPTVGGSPPGSPQTNGSVVNGSEESAQRSAAKEPDFQPSFLIGVPDGSAPGGSTVRTRPSRWRDPQQTARDQLAASRARRLQAEQAKAAAS